MSFEIPEEIKNKIIEKLYGMAYIRLLEEQKSNITIPEFKYIITRYKGVKKKHWFYLAKEFERMGIIKLHKFHSIEIQLHQIQKKIT